MNNNKELTTKSITAIDDYLCTLSEKTKEIAKNELRETVSVRRHALESLREWAEKNPRIKFIRLDSNFLLRFLRCKKFSLPMAKEMIERYLVLRHYIYEDIKVFTNFDYRLPVMQELIDLGYIFTLPKCDHLNRKIIMYRPGVFNPSKHHNYDMVKLHGLVYETIMEDEMVQVHGVVHIIDSSGIGLHYLTIFTPHEAYRIGRHLEKIVPMRHKQIHGLKVHPSLKFAVDFALSQMNEKMRKRVFLYKNIDDIDVDKSLLPLEYGGTIPMKEMIESFKKKLKAKNEIVLLNDKMDVHLDLYPESVKSGSVRSLKISIDEIEADKNHNRNEYGIQGSFRKLEID